jgi:hypothetical protein
VSRYLKSTRFETEFDGDKVSMKLRAISVADSTKVASLPNENGRILGIHLLPVYLDMLPRYVEEFDGLKDANGDRVTVEEVASDQYFVRLVYEIGAAIMKTGVFSDPKALALQPAN